MPSPTLARQLSSPLLLAARKISINRGVKERLGIEGEYFHFIN